jgi:arginyl-tRNA synthetase
MSVLGREVAGDTAPVIRDDLAAALGAALADLGVTPPVPIELERPARREHGDWSSNVVLASAKAAGRNPRELATEVAERLEADPPAHVESVEVAGPGFVNFRLGDTWLHEVLGDVIDGGTERFARSDVGGDRKVMVEFVSANPTGPVHAGHARGAAYGDSLARLLERTGHEVEREFLLNDRGVQMENFGASLAARKAGEEPSEDGYQGAYVTEWAAEMPDDVDPLEWGYVRAVENQRKTLERMNVVFDTWFSERSMVATGAIDVTLADLAEQGVSYEEDGATWLASTRFGDDKDRVLVKSDGSYTYLLPDIAYHRDKFDRGFDLVINVWGADHHGYVARMKAAIEALGHDPDDLEIVITQLVNLERDGVAVKLSKRSGDLVTLAEILDEVGPDAARLTFLLQSTDSRQTVDLAAVASEAMDNPVYYVQYAHARIHSIEAKAAERGVERLPLNEVDVSVLTHERELDLLRSLSELPDTVVAAVASRSPHQIAAWVRDLAGRFHGFYHDCYVMGEGVSAEQTQARLWLVEATRIGLAIGLDLLGVSAPEEM